MKIVVSGGGSGGHITPILAVAHHLKQRNNQVSYIGIGSSQEEALFEGADIEQFRITTGKFRRYSGLRWWQQLLKVRTILLNIRDMFRFVWGCLLSFWLLLRLKPDRVFIKGGYVGLPVGLAAWSLRIPFIIHESDSVPGLTNRILSRFTQYRLAGFDIDGFKNLGNPIRESLLVPLELDRSKFYIESEKPVLLVTGGSLGSAQLNDTVIEMAKMHEDFEIIHIYGGNRPLDLPELSHYHPYQFLTNEMAHALRLADVVVTRAGANTLSELAVLGKPSIVIPHPNLSGNHQSKNAQQWQDAIKLLPQSDLSAHKLFETICAILDDKDELDRLSATISGYSRPTAAADIADYIISIEGAGVNK